MNKILSTFIGLAVLLVGMGIFYHYVIYIPKVHDEKVQREELMIKEKGEKKKEVFNHYDTCLQESEERYANKWKQTCKLISENAESELKICLQESNVWKSKEIKKTAIMRCNKKYKNLDSSINCSLPGDTANAVETYHKNLKEECKVALERNLKLL